jgi:hypothetical protein
MASLILGVGQGVGFEAIIRNRGGAPNVVDEVAANYVSPGIVLSRIG